MLPSLPGLTRLSLELARWEAAEGVAGCSERWRAGGTGLQGLAQALRALAALQVGA